MLTTGTLSDTQMDSNDSSTSQSLDMNFFGTPSDDMVKRISQIATELMVLQDQFVAPYRTLYNNIQAILRAYGTKYNVPFSMRVDPKLVVEDLIAAGEETLGLYVDLGNKLVTFTSPIPFIGSLTFDEVTNVEKTIQMIEAGKDRFAKLFFDLQDQETIKRFMKYQELKREFGSLNFPVGRTNNGCCGSTGCSTH